MLIVLLMFAQIKLISKLYYWPAISAIVSISIYFMDTDGYSLDNKRYIVMDTCYLPSIYKYSYPQISITTDLLLNR